MSIIEVEGLHKSYDGTKALSGLEFKVDRGRIYGFLGPNGAGKTTAIKVLMGLVKADKGEARIKGQDVLEYGISARKHIGYLPEKISLYEGLTVKENLSFLCELKEAPKDRIMGLLSDFDMEKAADVKISSLSKGMLQRIGLVQALIGDPDILILDEPTSGLDPNIRNWVKDEIVRLKEKGKTVLLSSHVLSEVEDLCDEVGVISNGSLLAEDTIDNLIEELDMKPRIELTIDRGKEAFEIVEHLDYTEMPRLREDRLIVYSEPKTKMQLIKRLIEEGFEISDFKVKEPDLTEVFLRLTEGEE